MEDENTLQVFDVPRRDLGSGSHSSRRVWDHERWEFGPVLRLLNPFHALVVWKVGAGSCTLSKKHKG